MEALSRATVPTFLTFAFSCIAAFYFFGRWYLNRVPTSLALIPMCLGWAVVAGLLNGLITREEFEIVRWAGLVVTTFLLLAIARVEARESAKRSGR